MEVRWNARARKYITTIGNEAHIYHYGIHACAYQQNVTARPTEIVKNSLRIGPTIKPSAIQGNLVSLQRGTENRGMISKKQLTRSQTRKLFLTK